MLRESWDGTGGWQEYIYLGGHRIAMLRPGATNLNGGGCTMLKGANWQTVAVNSLMYVLPGMAITFWFTRKNKKVLKGFVILSALSGSMVLLSYYSSKADTGSFRLKWYLNDHLDTPMKMVDVNNTVVWDAKYDTFGNMLTENQDPDSDSVSVENNFRFPGQYHDRESGLYYNWNRYYTPKWGRYMQADKRPSLNLYVYALNNPCNIFDSNCLDPNCGGASVGEDIYINWPLPPNFPTPQQQRQGPFVPKGCRPRAPGEKCKCDENARELAVFTFDAIVDTYPQQKWGPKFHMYGRNCSSSQWETRLGVGGGKHFTNDPLDDFLNNYIPNYEEFNFKPRNLESRYFCCNKKAMDYSSGKFR